MNWKEKWDKYEEIIETLAKELNKISPDWKLKNGTTPDTAFTNTEYDGVADFCIDLKGNISSDIKRNSKLAAYSHIDFNAQEMVLIADACRKIAELGEEEQ